MLCCRATNVDLTEKSTDMIFTLQRDGRTQQKYKNIYPREIWSANLSAQKFERLNYVFLPLRSRYVLLRDNLVFNCNGDKVKNIRRLVNFCMLLFSKDPAI